MFIGAFWIEPFASLKRSILRVSPLRCVPPHQLNANRFLLFYGFDDQVFFGSILSALQGHQGLRPLDGGMRGNENILHPLFCKKFSLFFFCHHMGLLFFFVLFETNRCAKISSLGLDYASHSEISLCRITFGPLGHPEVSNYHSSSFLSKELHNDFQNQYPSKSFDLFRYPPCCKQNCPKILLCIWISSGYDLKDIFFGRKIFLFLFDWKKINTNTRAFIN
jgi:hypothetical protein